MRWIVEIGHLYINTKVSLLSPYSTMLRQGCLEAALHVSRLAFDTTYPNMNHSHLQELDWTDFYEGAV